MLLCHIESAERGYGLRSRLAVNGQAFCLLKSLDLAAGGTEVVSVIHVETSKTILSKKLLQLAYVVAYAAVLEHTGEYVLTLAVRDLRLRPEGRASEAVPAVAGKGVASQRQRHGPSLRSR